MNQSLNMFKLIAVVAIMSLLLSIPAFWYLHTQVEMADWAVVVFNYSVSLFVGCAGSGVILFMTAFVMGGTLPKWFWKQRPSF